MAFTDRKIFLSSDIGLSDISLLMEYLLFIAKYTFEVIELSGKSLLFLSEFFCLKYISCHGSINIGFTDSSYCCENSKQIDYRYNRNYRKGINK